MDLRRILPLFALLLIAGSAAAVTCDWSEAVGAVTFTKSSYNSAACIDYEWSDTKTANDFNNYIIHADGDVTLGDTNYGGNTFTLCTVEPGDTVTFYVQPFDGNAEGHYCGYDYNVTVSTPGLEGAARYLAYAILITIAAFIGVVVILIVIVWLLKKTGFRIFPKM